MDEMNIKDAISTVLLAISKERERLEEISKDDEADPICVFGHTHTGISAQAMVASSIIAEIYLRYDYPIYRILGLNAKDTMMREIAELVGFQCVFDVDL